MNDQLLSSATNLAKSLRLTGQKLVLAESCTCGLASAAMGTVPGISDRFCGSAVTYRESAKVSWLGIEPFILEDFSAESLETSLAMAHGVLQTTREANLAAAVTGHLGPNAPADIDGVIYVAVISDPIEGGFEPLLKRIVLQSESRLERQSEAAFSMLRLVDICLTNFEPMN